MGFEPSLVHGSTTTMSPFRFWCQKVLPLVYDNSLSYYELLCKVVEYLNETMENVNTIGENTNALYSSYLELVNYVNTYFDNLDVQEEINNKLDEMAESGELGAILANTLKNDYILQENIYKNKKVVIIGDSISDTQTEQPNWAYIFKEQVESVGGTVENISVAGDAFAYFKYNQRQCPVNADIVIVFMGVNDFQLQVPFASGTENSLYDAVLYMYNSILTNSPNAKIYYISPLKCYRNDVQNNALTLNTYRNFLEKLWAKLGALIISGYNAPILNSFTQGRYMSDRIHPTPQYAEILKNYIMNNILNECSTFTPPFTNRTVLSPIIGTGYTPLFSMPNEEYKITFSLNNVNVNSGWNKLIDVPAQLMNVLYSEFFETTGTYQFRLAENSLQIYSQSQTTISSLVGNMTWKTTGLFNSVNE